jgi:hypothetical protein
MTFAITTLMDRFSIKKQEKRTAPTAGSYVRGETASGSSRHSPPSQGMGGPSSVRRHLSGPSRVRSAGLRPPLTALPLPRSRPGPGAPSHQPDHQTPPEPHPTPPAPGGPPVRRLRLCALRATHTPMARAPLRWPPEPRPGPPGPLQPQSRLPTAPGPQIEPQCPTALIDRPLGPALAGWPRTTRPR